MKTEGFFLREWKGDPAWIESERRPSASQVPPGPCAAWKSLTGDSGWAGVAADELFQSPEKPVYLVYSPNVTIEIPWLQVIEELQSLMPVEDRWNVTFSTYFTQLAAGVQECSIRAILQESKEHVRIQTRPGIFTIDLVSHNPLLASSERYPSIEDAQVGTRSTLQSRSTSKEKVGLLGILPPKNTFSGRLTKPSEIGLEKVQPESHRNQKSKKSNRSRRQQFSVFTIGIVSLSLIVFMLITGLSMIYFSQTIPKAPELEQVASKEKDVSKIRLKVLTCHRIPNRRLEQCLRVK